MSNPITYKDLKVGDRVEITLKGQVLATNKDVTDIMMDGGSTRTAFDCDELALAKITLLEPELKVGRAEVKGTGRKGRVRHTDDEYAWFVADDGSVGGDIWHVSKLRNIPEDTDKGDQS